MRAYSPSHLGGENECMEIVREALHRIGGAGEIAENRIYGCGSVDMKGGLAAMIFVLEAFRETRTPLAMPVLLEAVVDEEGGGNGTLINRIRGIKAEQALIAEPTTTSFCCSASVGAHFFELPEFSTRWFGLRFPPSSIDPDHPWVRRVVGAARPIVSRDPTFADGPIVVGGGGSDLRLFHEYGIPAVP